MTLDEYKNEIKELRERLIIGVEQIKTFKDQGTIYASSEEIIRDAIHEIGEDNFKKYVLEVK